MNEGAVSPEAIFKLGLGFWGSKALLSAVELGVFSELANGPLSLEELRIRLDINTRGTRDFLDALVALGMLTRTDGRYANTAATDFYLDRAKPSYIGGLLEMANSRLYPFWGRLTAALQSGRPQNEAAEGGDSFAAMYANPELLRQFLSAMTGVSRPMARAVAATFPWSEVGTFADIGCAQGGCTAELALAHPHLSAIGFDLAPVQPVFEAFIDSVNLKGRARFVAGDFFKDPLPSAEVIVMGHILHDWGLDEKRMLIQKAYTALPTGGRLLVYDAIIDDERCQNAFGLLMSLNMLVETPGGFDYTGADAIGWMREAGFRAARVEPLSETHSMVVATK